MARPTLGDLGERVIIGDILASRYRPVAPNFGDDCVWISLGNGKVLVATTDPCPEPMAAALGFMDWYYRGWLLATINLSDLAAAGATPCGVLTAYELPPSTLVDDFMRLLTGVDDCLADYGTQVLGGNIKETSWISLSATALGFRETVPARRGAASPGDLVYLVGQSGRFWAGVLAYTHWPHEVAEDSQLLDPVVRPRPQLAAGIALSDSGLVKSLTDNSDGLYTTLQAISVEAGGGFDLTLSDSWISDATARRVAERLGLETVRLALGWGDWQLIAVVQRDNGDEFEGLCSSQAFEHHRIGTVSSTPGVRANYRGRSGLLLPLDSQRFAPSSWMSIGLGSYIDMLIGGPLVEG